MGKILIVDDEESIRLTLQEFLQKDGHDVLAVEDAEKATDILAHADFDVVVSDIILPRMTGLDLLTAIHNISPHTQVVMMTGKPTVDTASAALRAGAFDYLYKPVRKDAIIKSVGNALRIKALADEKRRLEKENRKHQEELELLVKERTRSLLESEKRYRGLVHASPDGIAIQQKDHLVFANESMEKILESISRNRFEKMILDITNSSSSPNIRHGTTGGSDDTRHVTRLEKTFQEKSGERISLDIMILPMILEGKPAVQIIARDITRQKYLEESLTQSQKMESIGTLAGGIAHDFNNILFSIMGYTELSMDGIEKDSKLYGNLKEILAAGNRAKDLIKQILTFSRQNDLKLQPVRMDLIVKEALILLRASLPTTIAIHKNIKSNATVLADPTQIHQVLMNLCINAGHAMEEKGGILTIELLSLEIDEDFSEKHPDLKPGPYISLNVCDTGHGIAPEVLNRIFDPFFTTKTRGDGTGLGLSVVHGIVKSCNGAIYVYTEPGHGTIFKVFIPAVDRRSNTDMRVERHIPVGTERILFVDDEPMLATMGKRLLESLGYKVVARTSSLDALALFREQPDRFDLVVTDMTMPDLTGEKLAESIITVRPDIPIILSTGFSQTISEKRGSNVGIKAFISKPVLKYEIADTIRKVLDGRQ
jgi:PAS domain S-box-containing protein